MKKILCIFILSFLLCSCSYGNNPSSKVEELLSKYQMCDEDIKKEINEVLDSESLSPNQKERYQKIIEKQYKNLMYEIKNEEIDGDKATITVSIEVLNYKKIINEVNNNYIGRDDYTVLEYNDNKLDKLEKVKEKVNYLLTFDLEKKDNGSWRIKALDSETIKKIQGMY